MLPGRANTVFQRARSALLETHGRCAWKLLSGPANAAATAIAIAIAVPAAALRLSINIDAARYGRYYGRADFGPPFLRAGIFAMKTGITFRSCNILETQSHLIETRSSFTLRGFFGMYRTSRRSS